MFELRLGLDPLGHHVQPERVSELDQRAHDRGVLGRRAEAGGKALVDLEHVDRQFAQPGQRRCTRAEVDDRDPHPDRLQPFERADRRVGIASQVGFPEWVEVDDQKMQGKLKALPERDEILPDINENLVVELYSK